MRLGEAEVASTQDPARAVYFSHMQVCDNIQVAMMRTMTDNYIDSDKALFHIQAL